LKCWQSKSRPILSNLLLNLCEDTELQPGTQLGSELVITDQGKSAILRHRTDRRISDPNLGHRPQISRYVKIGIEARIHSAKIYLVTRLHDEPKIACRGGPIIEDELNGNAALG